MKREELSNLFDKYLDGRCTPEEVALVEKLYNTFNSREDRLADLSDDEKEALRVRMLWQIASSVFPGEPETTKKIYLKRNAKNRKNHYWTAIAASLLLILSLFLWLEKEKKAPLLANQEQVKTEIRIVNRSTSLVKHLLPDGSRVWLSPESEVRFPKKFKPSQRNLILVGEAFFEVEKKRSQPFVVCSGRIITKVWGTSFRVRSFGSTNAEVAVVTGRVSVKIKSPLSSEVMLRPNQQAIYTKGSQTLIRQSVDISSSEMKIWRKTHVSFHRTKVEEVVNKLSQIFNTRIIVKAPEINNYLLEGDFSDQNLPDILEMLKKSLNVTYTINANQIEITTLK